MIDYNFNRDFLNADPEEIEKNIKKIYKGLTNKEIYPASPLNLFFKTITYIIIQLKRIIDYYMKQNFVDTSEAPYLDKLGRFVGAKRLGATRAVTTLRFFISAIQKKIVTIPAGIRVTPGDDIYFKTLYNLEIKPGEIYGEIEAECTKEGLSGNGFEPGEINKLVDPFQWYQSVSNITKSAGGSDIEKDDDYRERVWDAPLSYSTCGPENPYRFWAKTASPLVVDAGIDTPEPGHVLVVPVLKNGELPTQDILDLVYTAVNSKDRRPLTDFVHVEAPEIIEYDIDIKYWINKNEINAMHIQDAVSKAIDDYILWQRVKLGRDINPSKLIEMVIKAGAKRVEVKDPVFFMLEKFQIAIVRSVNVSYEGLEDD